MKKLFTMLGAALMMGASAIPANAEDTTIWICDWDGNEIADSYTTTITGNEDGSYTIADFLNSGQSVTFTFVEPQVGKWNDGIEITSSTYLPEGYTYPFIMTPDGQNYVDGKAYNLENVEGWTTLESIYVAAQTYSGIYRYDLSDPSITYEYYASICTSAYLENGDYAPWMYISFYFNKPGNESSNNLSVYVCDENDVYYENFETGFVKNEDGSYTLTDFLNSDNPVSFTFSVPEEEGVDSAITFVGNVNRSGSYVEFLTPDGGDMSCKIYPTGSKKSTTLWYPTAYESSANCLVEKLTEEEAEYYGGEYYCLITFYGTLSDGSYSDWYYAFFYFDLPESSGSTDNSGTEESGTGEPVATVETNIFVMDYDYNDMADSVVSNVIAYDNGTYAVENFLNSGQPVSFKFTPAEAGEYSYDFKITSPLDTSVSYPYLMSEDGEEWLDGKIYGYKGSEEATNLYYLYTYQPYNCVYTYPEGSDHDYWVYLCLNAYADIQDWNTFGWFWVGFYVDAPKSDDSGVEVVEDSDAPVEYYNLNGVKVANPSNGIFIRKQGNSVKKVVIK